MNSKGFRTVFPFTNNPKVNWYPGHMNRIYRELPKQMKKIDILLEVRDSRIPITSGNPELLKYMNPRIKRIILFNKFDLCDQKKTELIIKNNFKDKEVMVLSAKTHSNIRKILDRIGKEKKEFSTIGIWAMVCGIPNVGKSSIINVFRAISNETMSSEKLVFGAKKGALPTTTRHIDYFHVSKIPNIYIMDTPGIIPPKINRYNLDSFKLSACRNISAVVVEKQMVVDYILFHLNKSKQFNYVNVFNMTSPVDDVVSLSKEGLKTTKKPTENDFYDYFIKKFNEGELGKVTFDEEEIKELVVMNDDNNKRTKSPNSNQNAKNKEKV